MLRADCSRQVFRFGWSLCLGLSLGLSLVRGQDESAQPVEVAEVIETEILQGHRVVGTVNPLRTSTVGAATAGRVADFLVNVGQAVTVGQPLAQLRTETLKIELRAANAELELYRQQLVEQQNGSRAEDVAEAEAQLQVARAAQENASAQLVRLRALAASGAATDADLEDARERASITQFAFSAADAAAKRVKSGPREERIAQAAAQVELQQQRVNLIKDRIEKHTLRAPFDGFVSAEYTEVGAWVASGDPVAQVIQLNQVEIQAPVTAQYAIRLKRGDAVRVEFPELPDKLLTGTIDRVVPMADSRARTFPVLVRLDNEIHDGAPLLMAGMLARVDLPAGGQQLMPLVPKDALVLNARERSVYVVDLDAQSSELPTGIVRKVPVQLGVAVDDLIQVSGALSAGQLVVVVGNERLIPESRVKIVPRSADSEPAQ